MGLCCGGAVAFGRFIGGVPGVGLVGAPAEVEAVGFLELLSVGFSAPVWSGSNTYCPILFSSSSKPLHRWGRL
eukprot:7694048-Prorocentrum_lima.AAC.1